MAKMCLTHKTQPSVTMCHRCHKPICKSCVTVTPNGSFCSSECSIMYKEIKGKLAGGAATNYAKVAMLVVLVLIMGVFFLHFMARTNESLRSFDFLGSFFGYPEKPK